MAYRPNFTALELEDDAVVVHGISDADDPSDLEDIVSINIVLVQGGRVARGAVDEIATAWVARVPLHDGEGDDGSFNEGEATVFGVEARYQHAATITWAQAMEIVAAEA
jgi:hypothetical protein